MIDISLTIQDIPDDQAGELWARLSLVAEGFLRDGRSVDLTTYRATDDGDYESIPDPSQENHQ